MSWLIPPKTEINLAGQYKPMLFVNSIRNIIPGAFYICINPAHNTTHLVEVTCVWRDKFYMRYVDPHNLERAPKHVNSFEFCVWDFAMMKHPKQDAGYYAYLFYTAIETDYCPKCLSESLAPIQSFSVVNKQRVGYSTNYLRCNECDHIWRNQELANWRYINRDLKR